MKKICLTIFLIHLSTVAYAGLIFRPDGPGSSPLSNGYVFYTGVVSFDSSYPAGGYTPLASMGFNKHFKTLKGVVFDTYKGYEVFYDKDTEKIRVFLSANLEVGVGANISHVTSSFFSFGYGINEVKHSVKMIGAE